jgi:hypothetical protein
MKKSLIAAGVAALLFAANAAQAACFYTWTAASGYVLVCS